MYQSKFPIPRVTVDAVVLYLEAGQTTPEVLLIRRGDDPYKGKYALPGGHPNENEQQEDAVVRELVEETQCNQAWGFSEFGTYSTPGRDPRGWTVSTVYTAISDSRDVTYGDDADDVVWTPFDQALVQQLAFDHNKILADVNLNLSSIILKAFEGNPMILIEKLLRK